MIRISLEFYDLIRYRINLSDIVRQKVKLTKKAHEYTGICPFHIEKSPSFTVSDTKRFYHCFGCGAHGDVIKFVSQLSGLSYKEAAIKLASENNIPLPKLTKEQEHIYEESDEIYNILELAVEFFMNSHNDHTLNYLNKRGINEKIIQQFSIGFAPSGNKLQQYFDSKSIPLLSLVKAGLAGKREDGKIYEIFHDRIIFPIRNIYSKVVGFGGRVIIDIQPKYINSPETLVFKKSDILYGENVAITASYKRNYAIIVEGYLDVIALHKAGYVESLASLGTAVTANHLQKLWKAIDEVVICLDGDAAGKRASDRIINLSLPLVTYNKKISFIMLPDGCDPDNIVANNETGFFQTLIDTRMSLSEIIWYNEYSDGLYRNAESRATLESKLNNYCKLINDKILSKNYYNFFQEQIWQKISKRGQKKTQYISLEQRINIKHDYSELEILEYSFCLILIKFPDMLQIEEIKSFLETFDFKNNKLSDFRDWFFTNSDINSHFDTNFLESSVKNTRFYDTFLLLMRLENLFLDKSFDKSSYQHLFWKLLIKKYYLMSLKQEYVSLMQNGIDDVFEKATLYREEITKLSSELQKLNESFFK